MGVTAVVVTKVGAVVPFPFHPDPVALGQWDNGIEGDGRRSVAARARGVLPARRHCLAVLLQFDGAPPILSRLSSEEARERKPEYAAISCREDPCARTDGAFGGVDSCTGVGDGAILTPRFIPEDIKGLVLQFLPKLFK